MPSINDFLFGADPEVTETTLPTLNPTQQAALQELILFLGGGDPTQGKVDVLEQEIAKVEEQIQGAETLSKAEKKRLIREKFQLQGLEKDMPGKGAKRKLTPEQRKRLNEINSILDGVMPPEEFQKLEKQLDDLQGKLEIAQEQGGEAVDPTPGLDEDERTAVEEGRADLDTGSQILQELIGTLQGRGEGDLGGLGEAAQSRVGTATGLEDTSGVDALRNLLGTAEGAAGDTVDQSGIEGIIQQLLSPGGTGAGASGVSDALAQATGRSGAATGLENTTGVDAVTQLLTQLQGRADQSVDTGGPGADALEQLLGQAQGRIGSDTGTGQLNTIIDQLVGRAQTSPAGVDDVIARLTGLADTAEGRIGTATGIEDALSSVQGLAAGDDRLDTFLEEVVRAPIVERFQEDVIPGIGRRFGGANFFSGDRRDAELDAQEQLAQQLFRETARSAVEIPLTAAGQVGNLATSQAGIQSRRLGDATSIIDRLLEANTVGEDISQTRLGQAGDLSLRGAGLEEDIAQSRLGQATDIGSVLQQLGLQGLELGENITQGRLGQATDTAGLADQLVQSRAGLGEEIARGRVGQQADIGSVLENLRQGQQTIDQRGAQAAGQFELGSTELGENIRQSRVGQAADISRLFDETLRGRAATGEQIERGRIEQAAGIETAIEQLLNERAGVTSGLVGQFGDFATADVGLAGLDREARERQRRERLQAILAALGIQTQENIVTADEGQEGNLGELLGGIGSIVGGL